jgi:hypothetical protein
LAVFFVWANVVVTGLFAAELILNFLAHGNASWLCDWSNLVDIAVVAAGAASIIAHYLAGAAFSIPSLKTLRFARLVRVLQRLGLPLFRGTSHTINALSAAVTPMCHSLLVLVACTVIYATVGTLAFRTTRPECFSDLVTSLETLLLSICGVGEVWGTRGDGVDVVIFLLSYIFLSAIVVLNV